MNSPVLTVISSNTNTLSGFTLVEKLLDTANIKPFSTVTVFDIQTNATATATISYIAANGTFSGLGLSAEIINNGIATYTITSNSIASLQQALQSLIFTPTAHQGAMGQTYTTPLTLKVTDQVSNYQNHPAITVQQGLVKPSCFVFDTQGHLWVANTNYIGSDVEEFSTSGGIMQTLSTGINKPTSLVFDSQGHLWVANGGSKSTVEEFSTSGILMHTLSVGINAPENLVFDLQGHLWVASRENNIVEEFSGSGVMQTLINGINAPDSLVFDSMGHLWVANEGSNTIAEFSSSGALLNTVSHGINFPQSLLFDSQGHLWVTNWGTYDYSLGNYANGNVEEFTNSGVLIQTLSNGIIRPENMVFDSQGHLWVVNEGPYNYVNANVEEFSVSGSLMQTLNNGIINPTSLLFDSQGNLWVGNQTNLEEFSATKLSQSVTYQSTQITVTETAQHLTVNPNNSVNNPTVFNTVHSGDTISFADATRFTANVVTASNVIAAGGSVTNLAGWVAGALNAKGANEASHNIDWFNFNGNTYLIEQANAQGSAYTTGDTLVQLVGVLNENHAIFSGHTLTLA